MTKTQTIIILISILIMATLLRLNQIGKLSFWNDEAFSYFAANASLKDMFDLDPNMSLFNFITHWWVRISTNHSEARLRLLSLIFSVASIPVVFLLGKLTGDTKEKSIYIGISAATLVTINAYHIQYAQEFRGYSLVFLLSTLSTYFLIKAMSQSNDTFNRWWPLYVLAIVGSIYSHYYAVLIFLAQGISLIFLVFKDTKNFPSKGVVVSGLLTVLLSMPIFIAAINKGAEQISWIPPITLDVFEQFAIDITGNQGKLLLYVYTFLLILGTVIVIRQWTSKDLISKWKYLLIISCLLIPLIVPIIISKAVIPIFLDRYLLFILPYMTILAAQGIVGLTTKKLTIPVAVILTIFTLVLSIQGIKKYFDTHQKEDWRNAAKLLSNNCTRDNSARLYYNTYVDIDATYYDPNLKVQDTNWIKILNSNPSTEEINNMLPNNYEMVCLTISHVEPNTPNFETLNNIRAALQNEFPNASENKFYLVDVEIYRK